MERIGVATTGLVAGWTAETEVDVLVVKVDAQFCKESFRLKGPLLEVLVAVYSNLNDLDEDEEYDDAPDLTTPEGVLAALNQYSERAGEEDDVVTIINTADMTEIF